MACDRLAAVLDNNDSQRHSDAAAAITKCEAVLNAGQAEIAHVHAERQQDLRSVTLGFLDGQIAFHEHALGQLKAARDNFVSPRYEELVAEGPRFPSLLERAALAQIVPRSALPEPSSFGLPPSGSFTPGTLGVLGNLFAGAAGIVFGRRSASSAIQAQQAFDHTSQDVQSASILSSPSLAASRFVQFLDWTTNSRGEDRKHVST